MSDSITQFGLCKPNMSLPNSFGTEECSYVLEKAEQYLESWTYWDTHYLWDDSDNIVPEVAIFFARPYPMATAGTPKSVSDQRWDATPKSQRKPSIVSS